eukprot:3865071-Rhodomonas_salina.1
MPDSHSFSGVLCRVWGLSLSTSFRAGLVCGVCGAQKGHHTYRTRALCSECCCTHCAVHSSAL